VGIPFRNFNNAPWLIDAKWWPEDQPFCEKRRLARMRLSVSPGDPSLTLPKPPAGAKVIQTGVVPPNDRKRQINWS
jgi:hypothetical protein